MFDGASVRVPCMAERQLRYSRGSKGTQPMSAGFHGLVMPSAEV